MPWTISCVVLTPSYALSLMLLIEDVPSERSHKNILLVNKRDSNSRIESITCIFMDGILYSVANIELSMVNQFAYSLKWPETCELYWKECE